MCLPAGKGHKIEETILFFGRKNLNVKTCKSFNRDVISKVYDKDPVGDLEI